MTSTCSSWATFLRPRNFKWPVLGSIVSLRPRGFVRWSPVRRENVWPKSARSSLSLFSLRGPSPSRAIASGCGLFLPQWARPGGPLVGSQYQAVHITRRWGTFLGQNLFKLPWYKRLKDYGEILSYRIPYDMMIMSNDGTEGDKVAEKLGYPMEKHRFWLDGTSPDIYQPDLDVGEVKASIGLAATDKMIFGVARLNDWKRFDRTIDAMPAVLRRIPNAHLVIAGDGPLRSALEAQIERLGLQDKVQYAGQRSQSQGARTPQCRRAVCHGTGCHQSGQSDHGGDA